MYTALLVLSTVALIAVIAMTVELAVGRRQLRWLKDIPVPGSRTLPSISVVIAARNEARTIEQALGSVLALDAPVIEIIVVDDRSDDDTGAILDRMAGAAPHRLRVIHLTDVPAGWLGKNHALWRGALEARGELLLFTDADVVMAPSVAARAASHLVTNRLDHLAAAPDIVMPGLLLRVFGVAFTIFFSVFARPWKASDPRSQCHIGIGAFNLIRASAYEAIGGHRPIAMRPDDDIKLGKLLKKHGLRQEFVVGSKLLSVEWYASLRELVHGLEKNTFAGLSYSVALVVLATIGQVVVFVWPFAGLVLTHGVALAFNALSAALLLVAFIGTARQQEVPAWTAPLFPLASLGFVYIVWNSALTTLIRGGIEWRGTRYSLEELRANRV